MVQVIKGLLRIAISLPLLLLTLHTAIRVIRHFYKFPMPQFLANLIDNPLRRRIQPPATTPIRHGVEPGMLVLEVGPGNGRYTLSTAERLGDKGQLVTIDIEPKMIQRVKTRAAAASVANISGVVSDVHQLPFNEGQFDLIYLIAVIGEIPRPDEALVEFKRVLSETGSLVFSELIFDPDYPRAETLIRKATASGYRLKEKIGNIVYYTLRFEKEVSQAA
jgi:ubiquinone/menaquinone biosynthesis C-methylase UbiE